MDMMFQPLRKYADFNGRARRSEYWMFALFIFIVCVVLDVLVIMMGGGAPGMSGVHTMTPLGGVLMAIFGLFWLAIIIPTIAVTIRRLHDTDRSGWWILLNFVPFLGIVVLIFMLLDGTPGPNKFGEDPKGRSPVAPAGATA